jgi:predicted phage terminase large subunit-like protein
MRKTRSREYIVIDVVRDRRTPAGVEQLIRETMLRDGRRATQWLEEDPGSAGKAEVSHLTRQLGTNGYVIRTRRPQGSKVERANPLSAMAEQGHVKIVKAPWNEPFLRELHGFPDAAHDDQVDAASGSYSVLSTMRRILVA